MPKVEKLSPGAIKLLQEPQYAHLVTLNPDGSPQVTVMWVDVEPDGRHVLINTSDERIKLRNVKGDKRVAVSVVDKDNPWRFAVVKGTVEEMTYEGANDHIDSLAQKYLGQPKYTFPSTGGSRIILRIKPDNLVERGV